MVVNRSRLPFVDDFLPTYDIQSQHSAEIRAPAEIVYDTARTLDLSGSWMTRSLFRLRGLPASALTAEGLARIRFKPLIEERPHGFVLGIIGQFWTISGHLLDFDPHDFASQNASGYAKAIWSFDVTPISDSKSRLRTITRVRCPDEASRRQFKYYWRAIGPFSGLIRREALKVVQRTAEAHHRSLSG
jgi:hypothetical protein